MGTGVPALAYLPLTRLMYSFTVDSETAMRRATADNFRPDPGRVPQCDGQWLHDTNNQR